eukprot:7370207-Alexandrium_andersonii.AAC.1
MHCIRSLRLRTIELELHPVEHGIVELGDLGVSSCHTGYGPLLGDEGLDHGDALLASVVLDQLGACLPAVE